MNPGTLTHNFARIAHKAGLKGVRFHDLRRTFASLMLLGCWRLAKGSDEAIG